ncbi:PHD-zinc-finger like domain-containing protein [Pilaira anomala]|nr:PHD-zinc-finger like domain-containing protein [Pilaira anomala]
MDNDYKRRGRPRKYPTDLSPSLEDKPREECSYQEFFPDLNIKEPLPITRILEPTQLAVATTTTEQDTTPDLIIEEGDTLIEEKIKKLPIVSYKKIQSKPVTITTTTNQIFHRPENHYIRYIEPSESELFETVEYDMDEQDDAWLKIYNAERQKENLGQISCDLFENIIDQLEKEWFDLTKGLPKKTNDEPILPEDSTCAICDDSECENSNAIVFCDGCNLAVHQDCYGIPYIPEGQWLCRKCMVSPENPVSCIFCPGEGGAFKQTTSNQWGHLLCAIWIPEVGLGNSVYMEPIDNVENVPKSRWKLTCYICRKKHGACIQCDNKHCFVAFHVTCARWARLCMRMKLHGTHYDGVLLKAYCDRHTPKDYREIVDVDKYIVDAQRWFMDPKRKKTNAMPKKRYIDYENEDNNEQEDKKTTSQSDPPATKVQNNKKHRRQQAVTQLLPASKAARAHQHEYSAGAPIAPDYILNKLENLKAVRTATHLKKKSLAIASICRYWSLKRESRRGAPLLKRLHLEPWTASASQLKQSEVEKAQKASSMITLRADLDKLRLLTEQVQKREKYKLDKIRKQKAYLEMILYPIELVIQPIPSDKRYSVRLS